MPSRKSLAVLILGLAVSPVYPLTDEEIYREFRYNLINPGARSLALGGAFISLADDATAAQANPAGLAYLLRKEYFIEFRGVDNGGDVAEFSDSFPTGGGVTVASSSNQSDSSGVSFASFVLPVKRFTFGVSLQEALNIERVTENGYSLLFGTPANVVSAVGVGSLDVYQLNLNASAGFRVSDQLALGVSLVVSKLDVDSSLRTTIVDDAGVITGSPTPPSLDFATRTEDEDVDFGVNVGIIGIPSRSVRLGAVYRKAPEFSVEIEDQPGEDVFNTTPRIRRDPGNVFKTPDSYGAGVSWQMTGRLMVALDVERIEYSDLLDGFLPGVNVLTGPGAEFKVDDATEVRVGCEYVLFGPERIPIALRAGLLTQSDNRLRASSTGAKQAGGAGSLRFPEGFFPGGDDEIHGTGGLGLAFPRLKLDFGFDLGPSNNEFVLSAIFQGP